MTKCNNKRLWTGALVVLACAVPLTAKAQNRSKAPAAVARADGQHVPPGVTSQQSPASKRERNASSPHHDHAQDIIVTGVPRRAEDVLSGVSVLDEADLARAVRPSIGETLARQPGVSATSFGPTASAPVLRGLSGDRIRVLTDGIGSLDLSSSGPDHVVTINPLSAERIEVLRGPSALLFGSSAIGGVVNVIDRRLPRSLADERIDAAGLVQYGSAADERAASVALDTRVGSNIVVHADASYAKSDDLRTGGFLLSPALRRQAEASDTPEIRDLAELKGELPNSAARTTDVAGGIGYISGDTNLAVAVSRNTARYGVPLRFSFDPEVEAEAPTIDARQTRIDWRAAAPVGGFIDQVTLRGAASRYRHSEIEETGEVGSRFASNGGEARLELTQGERSGWGGTSGVQVLSRTARIRGEEKFLPDSRQHQAGLFTLQTLRSAPWRFEAGARLETSRLRARADGQLGTTKASRSFTTVSGAAGASYDLARHWRLGLSLSSSARAPAVDELFADGPHAGSQAFERGNRGLDPERSLSAELSLRRTAGPVRVVGNLFYSRFANYIFKNPTGEIVEDLPVYEYQQGRARYYGFELQGEARLGRAIGIDWGAELVADAVRATVRGFGPAPQIPPLRLQGAVTASRGRLDGRLEVEHAFEQDRTAPLELPTPAYTLLNASIEWHPSPENPEILLSLAGNNLFDVTARRHTSLIKDYAPLAGRDIRLVARLSF